MGWSQVTTGAFNHRDDANIFKHRGRVWFGGGYYYGSGPRQDLLASDDGTVFTTINSSTPWEGYQPICAHNDAIFCVDRNYVWRTQDGVNITQVVSSPAGGVYTSALLSFGGKLWLIIPTGMKYSADDGATWSSLVSVPWASTVGIRAIAALGKIVVFATVNVGTANTPAEANYVNDTSLAKMYVTDDPTVSWDEIDCPYHPRMWPGLAEHENYLYLSGGYNNMKPGDEYVQKNLSDTWYWKSGDIWRRVNTSADYSPRHAPSLISYNGRLRLYAGNTGPTVGNTMSDIWELVP